MSAATETPKGIEIPTGKLFLGHREVQEAEDQIKAVENSLNEPGARLDDRQNVIKQLVNIKRDLDTQRPPPPNAEQRDWLVKEEKRLIAEIVPDMPSQEEMRKCPPGAIGREIAFQKKHKSNIVRWKNIKRMMNIGDDNPDVSNLELHRGTTNHLNMDNAVIPGKQHFLSPDTPEYRENYDRTFRQGAHAEGVDEAQALLDEVNEKLALMKQMMGSQTANTQEKPSGEAANPFSAMSKCGREFTSSTQPRANNAVRMHARHCETCKPAAA